MDMFTSSRSLATTLAPGSLSVASGLSGWREHKDPSTGRMYYWKEAGCVSAGSWEHMCFFV